MTLRFLATALAILTGSAHAETGLLYFTNFNEFEAGENQWAGSQSWFTNPEATDTNVQGIDANIVIGLGKSAFLGANTPSTHWTYVAKAFNHNPTTEGSSRIEIESLLGIQDSINGFNDSFYVSIYNNAGEFLSAIQFSTETETYGIWRDDGQDLIDTTVDYLTGELQLLVLDIDFINNRWSAEHDGIPLFTNEIFTKTGKARTFGSLAYEWQVSAANTEDHGDNWLLVADCIAWAIPPGLDQVTLSQPVFSPEGHPVFQFTGEPGWTYQVEYTDALDDWSDDLPDSRFVITSGPQTLEFTGPSANSSPARFYRLVREVTP